MSTSSSPSNSNNPQAENGGGQLPSRREFLQVSAATALAAGAVQPLLAAVGEAPAAPPQSPPASAKDPYALAARFNKFLRVTDVTDGLDAVGRADLTLLDPAIRPLWMGMRFFGPAMTMRVVPTNRRMPVVERKDALKQHAIWNEMGGMHAKLSVKPGCVLVTSTNGARECGYWGSNNSLDMQSRGVAGIVTERSLSITESGDEAPPEQSGEQPTREVLCFQRTWNIAQRRPLKAELAIVSLAKGQAKQNQRTAFACD